MQEKVGDFFVEFSAQGLAALTDAIGRIGADLGRLGAQAGVLGEKMKGLANSFAIPARPIDQAAVALAALAKQSQAVLERWTQLQRFGRLGFLADQGKEWQAEARRASAQALGTGLGTVAAALAEAFSQLGRAILPATAALFGWATAGVMASSAGQVLGYQFQELSRQLGSLFMPQIQWLMRTGTDLILWFQSLSGAQQRGLRNWLLLAGGVSAVAVAMPVLGMAVRGVISGIQALSVVAAGARMALIGLNMAWVMSPVGLVITGIVAGLALIVAATTDWRDAMNALSAAGRAIQGPFDDVVKAIREAVAAVKELRKLMGEKPGAEKGWMTEGVEWMRRHHARRTEIASWTNLASPLLRAIGAKDAAKGMDTMWGVASPFNQIAALIGGMFGWDPTAKKKEGEGEPRQELHPKLGGFEEVDQTYRRIAEAAIRATGGMEKSPEEQALEELKKLGHVAGQVLDEMTRQRPPHTR